MIGMTKAIVAAEEADDWNEERAGIERRTRSEDSCPMREVTEAE
jgi:hypothetical protein